MTDKVSLSCAELDVIYEALCFFHFTDLRHGGPGVEALMTRFNILLEARSKDTALAFKS